MLTSHSLYTACVHMKVHHAVTMCQSLMLDDQTPQLPCITPSEQRTVVLSVCMTKTTMAGRAVLCCRYKEEATGALQEVRDQLAAAQEERHALERQARQQVTNLAWSCHRVQRQSHQLIVAMHTYNSRLITPGLAHSGHLT